MCRTRARSVPERLFGCWKKRDYAARTWVVCRTRAGVSPRGFPVAGRRGIMRLGRGWCVGREPGVSPRGFSVAGRRITGFAVGGTRLRFGRGWCIGREPGVSPRGFSVAGRRIIGSSMTGRTEYLADKSNWAGAGGGPVGIVKRFFAVLLQRRGERLDRKPC